MAPIVNTSQPVITRGVFPISVYSRVISLQAHVPAEAGAQYRTYTPKVGLRTWLLRMDIWLMNKSMDAILDLQFYLMTGTGEPVLPQNMIDEWVVINPVYDADIPGMMFVGPRQHFWWTMSRLYLGEARRFGLALENNSATVEVNAIASFQIAEG